MRALVQRVLHAQVTVNDEVISSIEQGLCIFIGISVHDTHRDMDRIVRKILGAKVFDDERHRKWKKNVVEKRLEILCVSQFTLYNTWKGNKPDFHNAMSGEEARGFYEQFLTQLKLQYRPEKIKDGQFGAYMQVSLTNDGPVTFEIETKPPRPQPEHGTPEMARVIPVCPVVHTFHTLYDPYNATEEEFGVCELTETRRESSSKDSDLDRLRRGTTEPLPPPDPAKNSRQAAGIRAAREAFLRTQAAQEALQQKRMQAELNAAMEACALSTNDAKKVPVSGASASDGAKPDDKGDTQEEQAQGGSSETAADTKPRNNDAKETPAASQDGVNEKMEEETRV
ncbi:uncharacterized protein LOC126380650 [Pectinophora gossypiella]|uniref:uncharacterized protein LOC126380650 n=1 Tax=Pectinophora gossypiella TaxID=13191 RepID=UPI00214DF94B|nr:uncharacterized protein LOC126380650 [Pectinophora gossypiella]